MNCIVQLRLLTSQFQIHCQYLQPFFPEYVYGGMWHSQVGEQHVDLLYENNIIFISYHNRPQWHIQYIKASCIANLCHHVSHKFYTHNAADFLNKISYLATFILNFLHPCRGVFNKHNHHKSFIAYIKNTWFWNNCSFPVQLHFMLTWSFQTLLETNARSVDVNKSNVVH